MNKMHIFNKEKTAINNYFNLSYEIFLPIKHKIKMLGKVTHDLSKDKMVKLCNIEQSTLLCNFFRFQFKFSF